MIEKGKVMVRFQLIIGINFAALYDWLKCLALLFQQIRGKTKTNSALLARVSRAGYMHLLLIDSLDCLRLL